MIVQYFICNSYCFTAIIKIIEIHKKYYIHIDMADKINQHFPNMDMYVLAM